MRSLPAAVLATCFAVPALAGTEAWVEVMKTHADVAGAVCGDAPSTTRTLRGAVTAP